MRALALKTLACISRIAITIIFFFYFFCLVVVYSINPLAGFTWSFTESNQQFDPTTPLAGCLS
jgi:TRAP-type mannitol/chloroaromatic compound transport system permease small subunit